MRRNHVGYLPTYLRVAASSWEDESMKLQRNLQAGWFWFLVRMGDWEFHCGPGDDKQMGKLYPALGKPTNEAEIIFSTSAHSHCSTHRFFQVLLNLSFPNTWQRNMTSEVVPSHSSFQPSSHCCSPLNWAGVRKYAQDLYSLPLF